MTELEITNDKILIGVPMERFTLNQWMHNRDAILQWMHQHDRMAEPAVYQTEGHRVDRNRDEIVAYFLAHPQKPDWLVMLDSDMEHPIDVAARLARHRKPVVGGLYFHRGEHRPLVFTRGEISKNRWGQSVKMSDYMDDAVYDYLIRHNVPMRDGSVTIDGDDGGSLLECDQLGTGSMIIHRSVLERLAPTPERPIPWFQYREGTRSEDIEFCDRVKDELGLPIYCDLSTISGHYNMVPMGQTQFRMYMDGRGLSLTSYRPVDAARWLAEDMKIEEAEALESLKLYVPGDLARHWRTFMPIAEFANGDRAVGEFQSGYPMSAEDVQRFYRDEYTGELYLKDLLRWNATAPFQYLRKLLINERNRRVLEIGAGIGTLALQMVVQGCEVDAVEPNDRLRAFLQRRYDRSVSGEVLPANAGSLAAFKELTDAHDGYDLVLAMDVFEHIPAEDMPSMLKALAAKLKFNGRLWTHNNWAQQDIYPMHFDHSARWHDWLAEAGLHPLDELWAVKVSERALVR